MSCYADPALAFQLDHRRTDLSQLAIRWHRALRELAVDLDWPAACLVEGLSSEDLSGQDDWLTEDDSGVGVDEVEVEDFVVDLLLFAGEDE
jgi:hypothetical protein